MAILYPPPFFCFTSLPCEKWAERISAGSLVSSFNHLKYVNDYVTKVFSITCLYLNICSDIFLYNKHLVSDAGDASIKGKWVFVQNVLYFCSVLIKTGRPRQMYWFLRKFFAVRGESNRHIFKSFFANAPNIFSGFRWNDVQITYWELYLPCIRNVPLKHVRSSNLF
jgi:hypothetical protein